jgi:hypothetical protein
MQLPDRGNDKCTYQHTLSGKAQNLQSSKSMSCGFQRASVSRLVLGEIEDVDRDAAATGQATNERERPAF